MLPAVGTTQQGSVGWIPMHRDKPY